MTSQIFYHVQDFYQQMTLEKAKMHLSEELTNQNEELPLDIVNLWTDQTQSTVD